MVHTYIYKIVSGSAASLNPNGGVVEVGASTIDPTHSYQIDASAVGTSPTTLSITVTDLTTSTQVISYSVTDSEASLQNATGAPGLVVWSGNGSASTNIYSSFTSYIASVSSLSISPSSISTGGNRTIAVTGSTTAFTGTPFTLSGGTGASIVSQSVTDGTHASVVVNPGTANGTLTLTDTGSGANTTISVSAPSIAVSPSTVLVGTTTTVSVTGTGTNFAGTPFTLSGGTGASIVSQSVTDATHATLTLNTGTGSGSLVLTDTGTGATTAITLNSGNLKIGWVGDSITAGGNGGGDEAVNAAVTDLQNYGYTVTSVNQGHSGYGTADWVSTSTTLSTAEQAFSTAGVTVVSLMLGTNDARTPSGNSLAPSALTPQQHFTNMQGIVNSLTNAGFKVVLEEPIYTVPGSAFNGVAWPSNVDSVYAQYFALDSTLANGVNVFIGETSGITSFANAGELYTDGVHPSASGGNDLGALWAGAVENALTPLTISSISSGSPTTSGTTITWTTNKNSSSLISYGTSSVYSASSTASSSTTSHSITLSNLSAGTTYHYQINSVDASAITATSTDLTFTTASLPTTVTSSFGAGISGGGGGSVSITTQVANLIAMGKTALAQSLEAQWPSIFTPQATAVGTTVSSGNISSAAGMFLTNLTRGSTNSSVKLLQEYLNVHGFMVSASGAGSVGNETMVFGPATQAALVKFQKAKGITPAAGYFGPITRAYIAAHL
jgi:lysophospholipase L1-like esterase